VVHSGCCEAIKTSNLSSERHDIKTPERSSGLKKFLSNELRVSIIALGTSEALHVMRTDPQIAGRFQSCTLPSLTENDDLRRFLAGFLQQLEVDGSDIVNNRIAIDYILELTSGVTGRIVELVRLSARCAVRRDSRTVTLDLLQAIFRPVVRVSPYGCNSAPGCSRTYPAPPTSDRTPCRTWQPDCRRTFRRSCALDHSCGKAPPSEPFLSCFASPRRCR